MSADVRFESAVPISPTAAAPPLPPSPASSPSSPVEALASDLRELIRQRGLPVRVQHVNLAQDTLTITVDELRRGLDDLAHRLDASTSYRAPLGIFLTLLLALLTTSFPSRRLGLTGQQWEVVFACAAIASGVWLSVALRQRFQTKSPARAVDDGLHSLIKDDLGE